MTVFFTVVDYALFGAFLLLSLAVGVYHMWAAGGRSTKSVDDKHDQTAEFHTGGRKLPIVPVCLSLLTTFMSGIALLGLPAEIYERGFLFWPMFYMAPLSMLISGVCFLPIFYRLQATSVYEYFERRFDSPALRRVGAALFLLQTWFYMAVVMYAPAVALSGVIQQPLWPFVLAVGIASTIYTSIGGMKAVIWTDTLQAFFMYLGIGILIVKGTIDAGGLGEVLHISKISGRFDALFRIDPTIVQHNSLWIATIGGVLMWTTMYGLNQMALQRYCSMPSLIDAQIVIGITVPAFLLLGSMCCYIGVVLLAFFYHCDPRISGEIASQDQLVILFASKVLGFFPGMLGLFLACLSSGTLSTISSGINSMSAVLWEDFLKDGVGRRLSDGQSATLNKVVSTVIGLGATLLAFLCQYLGGMVNAAISVTGTIAGPLVGLFYLGIFCPRANKYGAMVGVVVAEAVLVFCTLGNNLAKPYHGYELPTNYTCAAVHHSIPGEAASAVPYMAAAQQLSYDPHYGRPDVFFAYRISPFVYAPLGILLVLLVGYPVSLLVRQRTSEAQRRFAYSLTFAGRHTWEAADQSPSATVEERRLLKLMDGRNGTSKDSTKC